MRGVGIIGTGRHGSRYVQHILHDIDGLELKAIARRSEGGREQALAWGVSWHQDWRELIADARVEAVISVVPPYLNPDIADACARAQKALLIEKPLAINSKGATAVVAAMGKAGVPLTVGQTLRYNQVIRALKSRLPAMGRLYSFTANQRLEPSSLPWHDERQIAGAGVMIHTAVHVFDALRYITGLKVERVMAAAHRYHGKNLEDLVTVLVEMEGGVAGTLDVSKVGRARSGRYEFVCENGQLYGEQVQSFVEEVTGYFLRRLEEPAAENTILALLRDWQDFLEGRGENPVSGEEGLYAVRVCEACLQSAEAQAWVAVGD
ncbi:MAG: Gfo/Idh/MocA family oxidoreductase [Desulfocapsaceae bacterium]|nr:Gfo/Idh/MocA family oxidoreductase [Desulfocapsaceae bacterium]